MKIEKYKQFICQVGKILANIGNSYVKMEKRFLNEYHKLFSIISTELKKEINI